MANYLKFDIYDLELTDVACNSDLRKLLIATSNRSILVVEDIDCSLDLENRKPQKAENPSSNKEQKASKSGDALAKLSVPSAKSRGDTTYAALPEVLDKIEKTQGREQ